MCFLPKVRTYRRCPHTTGLSGSSAGGRGSFNELELLRGLRMDFRLSHDELTEAQERGEMGEGRMRKEREKMREGVRRC